MLSVMSGFLAIDLSMTWGIRLHTRPLRMTGGEQSVSLDEKAEFLSADDADGRR